MLSRFKPKIKVADEVWVATALLHREQPDRRDFTIKEIVDRASQEAGGEPLRPGVYVHVVQHCVANRAPNPGRYRMLLETRRNHRRLFRPADPYDSAREGGKITPEAEDLPGRYHELLEWYYASYAGGGGEAEAPDPLLALRGSGRAIWADEHADEYVSRLRAGWNA